MCVVCCFFGGLFFFLLAFTKSNKLLGSGGEVEQ